MKNSLSLHAPLDALALKIAIAAALLALSAFASATRCSDRLCHSARALDDSASVAAAQSRVITFRLPVAGGFARVTVQPDGTVNADTAIAR